jgi:hypothetical protein
VFVLLDVPPGARQKVLVWEEGKFPDVVFEISSPSTAREDRITKRELYGRLGAREYYIFDPQGAMRPASQGFVLVGDRLEPLALVAEGRLVSGLLGAELRVVDGWLRVIDPHSGEPIPVPEELWARWQAAEAQAQQARARATREARARRAAEARARRAEDENAELRALVARLQSARPSDER